MDLEALKNIPLFKGLTEAELRSILELGTVTSYGSGKTVFDEDSDGTDVFVTLSGSVGIEISLPFSANREVIHTVRQHEIFGELALLDGHRRSARARALSSAELLVLPSGHLKAHLETNDRAGRVVMLNMARILAGRLRDTNMALRDMLSQQQLIFRALA